MDSPGKTVKVELTLRVGEEPIAGELREGGGAARPFVGWIALVRSLEDAMSEVDRGAAPRRRRTPSAEA
jgi:hypothetical protein